VPPYVPGQAAQPGWSGNGPATPQAYSSAPGGLPPAPPKKSRTGLIIGVVAAVLVLLIGGGYLLTNVLKNNVGTTTATPSAAATSKASTSASASAKPSVSKSSASSSASGYPGFKQTGSTLTGPNFTTTMPAGWTLSSSNGGKNEGEIVDTSNNIIDYYSDFTRSASANCTYQISSVTTASGIESSDPPAKVDGVTWAGSAATGMKVTIKRDTQTKREVFAFYCLDYNGSGYLIRTIAWEADDASVLTGAKSLLAAWKWQ
jgi:hypothetical protein